jgi:hypothetical protein
VAFVRERTIPTERQPLVGEVVSAMLCICKSRPSLWSEVLATDPEVQVRFPALQDFLTSSGRGRGPLSLVSTIEEPLG